MIKTIDGMPKYAYYYGFTKEEIIALADVPHKEALIIKKNAANDLAKRLLSMPFMEQNSRRINRVIQARKDNEEFLADLEY